MTEFVAVPRHALAHGVEMVSFVSEIDMTPSVPVAVDALSGDDLLEEIDRVDRGLPERTSFLLTVFLDNSFDGTFDAGCRHAAVTRARAPADRFPLEHRDGRDALCQNTGGIEAGVAATDDGDVDLFR